MTTPPARRLRIGAGGIAIESSTFSPLRSTLGDFTVLRGDEIGRRYPFMPGWRFRGRDDVQWLPCLYGGAIPGGPVERAAYEAMRGELLERVRAALPLDGFLLDIHGAMFVEGVRDAEADLAQAIRAAVGPECLISASMDLHGNVSARLVAAVDMFTAYRLAPHDDYLETREKACANLLRCLDEGLRPSRAWVPIPVILPGERTSTLVEPGRSVYASLQESDPLPGVLDASLWVGYVWADEPRSGACAVVTGTERATIAREAERIARRYWGARHAFAFVAPAGTADWCIDEALRLPGPGIVISDSGDNPTAGGVGDLPLVIGRLLARPAFATGELEAIYASVPDAAAVDACFAAGVGGEVGFELGAKLDRVHGRPLPLRGVVQRLDPDDPVGGRVAVLRCGGVQVIITARRKPYHERDDFMRLGLDPTRAKVTAVKIGYLVPELRAMASHALLALTDGAVNQAITSLAYREVPRPVFPLDDDFEPAGGLRAQLFGPAADETGGPR